MIYLENRVRPNGTHLIALFQAAIQYILEDISYPFDFVEATRKDRPVSLYAELHLAYYLEIGHRANLLLSGLAATILSALFIDHYVPEMLEASKSYRRGSVISRSHILFRRKWRSRLDNSIKSNSYCLDVPLGNIPYTIDTVEVIEDYRDIIILYISSGRIARDMLLGRSYLHCLFTNLIKRNESFLKDQRLPSILQPAQLTIANMVTQSPSYPDTQVVGSTYEPFESSYMRMIIEVDGISYLADNEAGEWILNTIQNPPLLAMVCVLFVSGLAIMSWLFWEYWGNYIWLTNRIFVPILLNALAGFLTTIISLYTAHDGDWSIMVLLTVITSGLSVACSLILLYIYKFGKLERLKQEHNLMFRNYEHPLHV
ncbi:unnamed protein product [Penicillium roqueforti FM164]|uniref:Genomic scaffold, ProqFM164S02 n=1 Tax=Penicillium roqueforti (strain FM164) TaxID=1365484 RepID=W6QTW1_PENRF|nr:unnamed protein product [Penicillium roqueforti FM164]